MIWSAKFSRQPRHPSKLASSVSSAGRRTDQREISARKRRMKFTPRPHCSCSPARLIGAADNRVKVPPPGANLCSAGRGPPADRSGKGDAVRQGDVLYAKLESVLNMLNEASHNRSPWPREPSRTAKHPATRCTGRYHQVVRAAGHRTADLLITRRKLAVTSTVFRRGPLQESRLGGGIRYRYRAVRSTNGSAPPCHRLCLRQRHQFSDRLEP
jgi:hypothetical protein